MFILRKHFSSLKQYIVHLRGAGSPVGRVWAASQIVSRRVDTEVFSLVMLDRGASSPEMEVKNKVSPAHRKCIFSSINKLKRTNSVLGRGCERPF